MAFHAETCMAGQLVTVSRWIRVDFRWSRVEIMDSVQCGPARLPTRSYYKHGCENCCCQVLMESKGLRQETQQASCVPSSTWLQGVLSRPISAAFMCMAWLHPNECQDLRYNYCVPYPSSTTHRAHTRGERMKDPLIRSSFPVLSWSVPSVLQTCPADLETVKAFSPRFSVVDARHWVATPVDQFRAAAL